VYADIIINLDGVISDLQKYTNQVLWNFYEQDNNFRNTFIKME